MTEPTPSASSSARVAEPTATTPMPAEPASMATPEPQRSMVLVAGSGRSGTSLFAGTLQRLGFRVPQPEVPPDDSNPRGFAESQWVVDFHTRLLDSVRVQTADARPSAWSLTATLGNKAEEIEALRGFLYQEYSKVNNVVIKDPRLSWFLPMWRRCADEFDVKPRFVTMLRHPAAVIDSKSRYYGNWQGDVGRAAGWINGMLFTERATREAPRVFVRYDDLLDDWTRVIARVGEVCDLAKIRDAPAPSLRKVSQFIDPSLSRSSASWDDIRMPAHLRDLCEHVWQLLNTLAEDGGEGDDKISQQLDEARAAYLELYQNAEAIAQSSVAAAKNSSQGKSAQKKNDGAENAATSWIPRDLRHKVPVRYRRKVLKTLKQLRNRAAPRTPDAPAPATAAAPVPSKLPPASDAS